MTSQENVKMLQEIMQKVNCAKDLLLEAAIKASEASHKHYLETRKDSFIESIIPQIHSIKGLRRVYESIDGRRYRVIISEIKQMTRQDEDALERTYHIP